MRLVQFLSILRARWRLMMIVLAFTVGTTIIVSLVLPKQYLATAAVVIDVKPDPIANIIYPVTSPAYMATQVDVIRSDRVARQVVRSQKLAENPAVREEWMAAGGQGNIESWLALALQEGLDVSPSRESSVINVSYKAPDPVFAAGMANAFIQAYLDTTLELRVSPAREYSSFFDSRSKELRENVERAQVKLAEFQRENGIIVSDERLDVETSRLNELSSQLVTLQAIASESGSRSAQAGGASGDKLQEVLSNPVIAGLKSDLARAEARLQELTSRLGDSHPQVVEARASIRELRSRLSAETQRVTGGVSVTNTINRQREAEVRIALETQRAKVTKLRAARDAGSVLQRDLENAQRAYDAVLNRLNQTSLESQTTQSNIFSLSRAVPPTKHASPKLLLNTALAMFIGGMLAVGAALLLESMDRRVRVPEDVTESVHLPVIGVLPGASLRIDSNRKHRLPPMLTRAPARLPSPERLA